MKKAVHLGGKVATVIVVIASAMWLSASTLSAQNRVLGKGKVVSTTSAHTSVGPVLTLSPGLASTIAGTGLSGYSGDGGPASSAQFSLPMGMAADGLGNLYVADVLNSVVRKISSQGTVSTVAGNGNQGFSGDGGPAISAQLAFPTAVALDGAGNLYIADYFNWCVRKVDTNGIISTFATAAPGTLVRGVATDAVGNVYYAGWFEGVWKVDVDGVISKVAGNGTTGFSGDGGPGVDAQTSGITGLSTDDEGNLYIAEVLNSDIRKLDLKGIITTVAGNQEAGFSGDGGLATEATFNSPSGVGIDAAGNLYIVDSGNNRIRKVNGAGIISTIAGDGNYGYLGDGGLASAAQFAGPVAILIDASGSMSIADTANNVIRKVQVDTTSLDFGKVTPGLIGGPVNVIVSNAGNSVLNFSNIVASSGFGVQTSCSTSTPVAPGSECSVDISFTPTTSGNMTGTVTFTDDAIGNPHVISLKGQGYIAPHPDRLAFATQFPVQQLNANLGVVTVNATDVNGNLATEFSGLVNIQILGPAGFVNYTSQAEAGGGIVTFDLSSVLLNVAGSYTIRASSSGLTSAQAVFLVSGQPDFSVSVSANSLNVGRSSAATLNATVRPTNGFTGTITLNCSGLPARSRCSFSPASLRPDGTNTTLTSTMTISTGTTTDASNQPAEEPVLLASAGMVSAGMLALILASFGRRDQGSQKKCANTMLLTLIVLIFCVGLGGCGTVVPQTGGTPSGKYTVTVTATSTGASRSTTFTLLVQ